MNKKGENTDVFSVKPIEITYKDLTLNETIDNNLKNDINLGKPKNHFSNFLILSIIVIVFMIVIIISLYILLSDSNKPLNNNQFEKIIENSTIVESPIPRNNNQSSDNNNISQKNTTKIIFGGGGSGGGSSGGGGGDDTIPENLCSSDNDCSSLSGICGTGRCNSESQTCYVLYNFTNDLCRESTGDCDQLDYCSGNSIYCNDSKIDNGEDCSQGYCSNGECRNTTTYYVDATNGNNSNNGLSPATAWKDKGLDTSLSPGDHVLFKRGETWRVGQLYLRSSGNSSDQIVYGAYGSGAKPIVSKMDNVTDWTNPINWTNLPFNEANSFNWTRVSSVNYGAMNSRTLIPANHFSQNATQIRVRMGGHLTEPVNISEVYIGEQSLNEDPYDIINGTIVQFKFNGNSYVNINTNGSEYSDWLNFSFNHTKSYIISIGINGSSVGMYGYDSEFWETSYYKTGQESNTSNPNVSGYGTLNANWGLMGYELNSSENSNIWYIYFGEQDPERVWLSGNESGVSEKIPRLNNEYSWLRQYSTRSLYVYSIGNPATTYSSMEISGKSGSALYCIDKNYLTFKDIDFRGGYSTSMNFDGCSNIIIENCNIGHGSGGHGISISDSDNGNYSDNGTMRNNNIDAKNYVKNYWHAETTDDGIAMKNGVNNWLVYNNSVIGWAHTGIALENFDASVTVSGNKIYDNYISCPDIEYGRGFGSDAPSGTYENNEFYNNVIYNTKTRSQIQGNRLKFYNNIIDLVNDTIWDGIGQGLEIYSGTLDPHDMEISNNIFINNKEEGLYLSGNSDEYDIINNSIINNIFYNNSKQNTGFIYGDGPSTNVSGIQLVIEDRARVLNNIYKNNLFYLFGFLNIIFYGRDQTDNYTKSVDNFNSMNGNSNDIISGNIQLDPLFLNSSNRDYRPQYLSPLIDAGTTFNRVSDILGNPIYGTPDIGPYEYQPPYSIGTNKIYANSSIRIYSNGKYRYLTQNTTSEKINLSIHPSDNYFYGDFSHLIDIININWSINKEFTINSSLTFISVFYVGDLENNTNYNILVDGINSSNIQSSLCSSFICTSNATGVITFNYTGNYINHNIKIQRI